MAETKRLPVFGSKPPCAKESRRKLLVRKRKIKMALNEIDMKVKDVIYHDSSDEEYNPVSLNKVINSSYNFVDFLRNREYGLREHRSFNQYYGTRYVITNSLLAEFQILFPTMNKIVCSQWLDHNKIILGTQQNEVSIFYVIL